MLTSERWKIELAARVAGVPEEQSRGASRCASPSTSTRGDPAARRYPTAATIAPRIPNLGDLRRHGFTQECLKCDAIRAGRRVGTNHTFTDAGNDNCAERAAVRRHEDPETAERRFAAGPADEELIMQDAEGDDGDQNMKAASEDLPPGGHASTDDGSAPAMCRHWRRRWPSDSWTSAPQA